MTSDFWVGEFRVLPDERRVLLRGQRVMLGERAFDLMLALVERRDRVVSKDELLTLVWPFLVVEENNLSVQISAVRKVLGGGAITTIAGRGYRFTATVTEPGQSHLALDQPLQKVSGLQTLIEQDDERTAEPDGWVPAALNSLIGRASAIEETLELLRVSRCLTLTGAGGSGKTRVALALGERLRTEYAGGVWWVELANLGGPKTLLTVIANTLGVSAPGKQVLQGIVERIKGRKTLLILDNCEHLIEDCAELAVQLLRTLPLLQVLATSRESLRIEGETAWAVPPLEVPGTDAVETLGDLAHLASVQLLVERIHQRNPKFALTQANAANLVQICRSLEGLPLALELIAGRVGLHSIKELAAQIRDSLDWLTGGHRGGMPHHQTMHAAIQWSCDLLSESERSLFVRLSVFAGGWTIEGAQAVCICEGIEVAEVPDLLARLERVSMVLASEVEGAMRFRMLEPIRQFASARLETLGLSEQVKGQQLDWYVAYCKSIVPKLTGADQALAYKLLTADIANLRVVLSRSQRGDCAKGIHLAASLWRFWQVKGHAKEMLVWFEETLPMDKYLSVTIQADAYNAAGIMARTCGLYTESIRLLETALAHRRQQGDRRGEAIALNNLAVVARDKYDHAMVARYCGASMRIAREVGDKNLLGLGLMHLGTAQRGQEQLVAAEASFRESFKIFTELGETRTLAALLNFLGNLAQAQIREDGIKQTDKTTFSFEAQRCYEQGLGLNQELEDFWGIGISAFNLASLFVDLQDHAKALPMLMQSFCFYRRAGVKHGLEDNFDLLAQITQKLGNLERAAWCWGVAEQLEHDIGKVISAPQQARRESTLRTLASQMTEPLFRAALVAGRRHPIEDAIRTVLALDALA